MTIMVDFDISDRGYNGRVDGFLQQGLSSLGCCLIMEMNKEVGGNSVHEMVVEGSSNTIKFEAEKKWTILICRCGLGHVLLKHLKGH